MKCTSCSKDVPEGAEFCPSCGYLFPDSENKKSNHKRNGMRTARILFGCVYALLIAAAAGYCFYRYLCEFHAPESVLSQSAQTTVYLSITPDADLEYTVIPSEAYNTITLRLCVTNSGNTYLSVPIAYGLEYQKDKPQTQKLDLSDLTFNTGKQKQNAYSTQELLPLLSEDAEGKLVFTYIGDPVFESRSFPILPFLKEDR